MKFFIVLFAVVAIACAIDVSDDEKEAWKMWKLKHSKLFLSGDKEKARMHTFVKNKRDVDDHNEAFLNGDVSWTKALHKFSDLEPEEFMSRFGGVKMDDNHTRTTPVTLRGTPPLTLDLTTSGGVNPIKDQGQCGSCWSFSTNAALECAVFKKSGKLPNLSEQNLVDCVYGTSGGCQGGWMPTAFDYIKTAGGIAATSTYPYKGANGQCKTGNYVAKVASTSYRQIASDDNSIKTALASNGVLSICVDATNWGSYKSGIFTDNRMSGATFKPSCSHAVALVGYGVDNNGIQFWKVRNSWNTWWGESGYIRMDARKYSNGNAYSGIMLDYAFLPNAA